MGSEYDWLNPPTFDSSETELETPRQLANPLVHPHVVNKRQFVNGLKKEALNKLIPVLPPPDTDLYIVGNGAGAEMKHGVNPLAFDFGTFIPHIVERLGNQGCTAYISSWTMNRTHVKSLLELFDASALTHITVFTDPYFKRREAAIANELIVGLLNRGQRFLAFKNHIKCIAICNPAGDCCTITGSANLSSQPRCEQYNLTTAPDVHAFYREQFFEAMLTTHAQESD